LLAATGCTEDPLLNINAAVYAGDQYVAVGQYDPQAVTPGFSAVLASSDGEEWAETGLPSHVELKDIAHGNDRFVAVGSSWFTAEAEGLPDQSSLIITSLDGDSWELVEDFYDGMLSTVTFGNGVFVAASHRGQLFHSMDGLTWEEADSVDEDWALDGMVSYGAGTFLAPGFGGLARSTDGVLWAMGGDVFEPANINDDLVFAGEQFVMAAHWAPQGEGARGDEQGYLFTSADGMAWDAVELAGDKTLRDITHDGDRYVALRNQELVVSDDGLDWRAADGAAGDYIANVTHAGDRFLALGMERILSSADGESWDVTFQFEEDK